MKGVIFYRRTFLSVEDNYVTSMGDTKELCGVVGQGRLYGGFRE